MAAMAIVNVAVSPAADHQGPPILAVDVDGVISLFGFDQPPPETVGRFHIVDGMPHFISSAAGERLQRLTRHYELVWATGWEERANDHLPNLLGLPVLPTLSFGSDARFGTAHWKLGPIGAYARGRSLAWIDDSLSEECYRWAEARPEPTLLVPAESAIGLEEWHVEALIEWAANGAAR
jgi:hypothetical protein